ncbi:MAG: CehA/McbA family metallohydrolase [Myxococcales bacterium]|nr:CehA/McbA family metallohydrolase [Myxococcales bacterium]MCB9532485.1 CehA/McbA family metallohydrolase [Myxococcales bacterium]
MNKPRPTALASTLGAAPPRAGWRLGLAVAGALVALAACDDDAPADDTDVTVDAPGDASTDATADASDGDAGDGDTTPDGDGDSADGASDDPAILGLPCQAPGRALAAFAPDGARPLSGPSALGGPGDVVLMNDRAAFVIQGQHDVRKTYWYYVGQPIDAVALDACAQVTPERFDELGVILGSLNLGEFTSSSLRGLRVDSIEVVDDGADGGEARVRVTGADDYFWLIELELIKRAFLADAPHGYSGPLGVGVAVDYVLEPDSPTLRMEVSLTNPGTAPVAVLTGLVNFFGDTAVRTNYVDDRLDFGGIGVDIGVPAIVSLARDHALGVAIPGARTGLVSIAGVDALVDADQFLSSAPIAPGTSRTDTFLLSVGRGGIHSAMEPLVAAMERPLPGASWNPRDLHIDVVDAETGEPVSGAEVVFEQQSPRGEWRAIDGFYVGDGAFDGTLVGLANRATRLRALAPGRAAPDALALEADATTARIELGPPGALSVSSTDGFGQPMPTRVTVFDGPRRVATSFSLGTPTETPLPPGTYDVVVTRGFEHAPYSQAVTVPSRGVATVAALLPRVVDTTDYMLMDGHVHGGPSPDSAVTVPMRALSLAAEGVEVAVSTDHEAIIPWAPDFARAGLSPFVATVLGEEVTPPLPEHSNAYPFPDRTSEAVRGLQVDWHYADMRELFAASRARGAQVVALNHPRLGCSYMCLVDYDRLTGLPRLPDPTLLGFEPDADLWSWDFDTIELVNGHRVIFVDPARPRETGIFDDWMSYLNLGHAITATGVTDTHDVPTESTPATYFASPTDDPGQFEDAMLVDSMLSGRALVSTGAFARVSIGSGTLGDTVVADGGRALLRIHVEALPEVDVAAVQVFANCDEVAWIEATDPNGVVKLDTVVPLTLAQDAHIVVVAHGLDPLPRVFSQFDGWGIPRVVTNPIYVDVDGDGYTAPGGKECVYTNPVVVAPKRAARASEVIDAIPTLHEAPAHDGDCH